MALSAEATLLMTEMLERSPGAGVRLFDPEEIRQIQRDNAKPVTKLAIGTVDDIEIPGPVGAPDVALRIYHPRSDVTDAPVLMFLHGGGWVMCSLDTHDAMCRRLSAGAKVIVVSVDYRLAPEHPFPAAIEDAVAATVWAQGHARELGGDPERVGVAGDSAGGNLAAVVALLTRDRAAGALKLQLLVYPVTNAGLDTPSYRQFADEGGYVTLAEMKWFWDQYVGTGDRSHPYASPLRADLSGLPPALVILAECDPLRDEGMAYADKLRAAGNEASHRCYEGVFHGFFGLGELLSTSQRALDDACDWLVRVFAEGADHGQP